MIRDKSFSITKKVYNYLLAIYGACSKDNGFLNSNKLLARYLTRQKIDVYYFIGSELEFKELLERCKYL